MKAEAPISNEFRDYFRNVYVSHKAGGRFLGITNGYLYLALVISIITTIPILLYQQLETLNSSHIILAIGYFLICNFIEYVLHRFPMHSKMPGLGFMLEHVTIHHKFYKENYINYEKPRDYMAVFLPILYLGSISAIIFGVSFSIYLISDFENAVFFCFFAYTYYFLYEALHFTYHAKEDSFIMQFNIIKKLASFHIKHHETEYMNKYNFNISFPIFDYIFKTIYNESENKKQ